MLKSNPTGNILNGFYFGKVIKHLSHGKLKVYIPSVYPESCLSSPDSIPDCMQIVPQFVGNNDGNGVFSYPNIGSTVICLFANNDQNMPLTFGSILGGQNAFGQYQMIKLSDEYISEKHMLTSGKTRIELSESGKLSASVYDSVRTSAMIDYDNDIVKEYPIQDKIDKEELSNINCNLILDNESNNGSIIQSTHYYDKYQTENSNDNLQEKYILTSDSIESINNENQKKLKFSYNYQYTSIDKDKNSSITIKSIKKLNNDINIDDGIKNDLTINHNENKIVNNTPYTNIINNSVKQELLVNDDIKFLTELKTNNTKKSILIADGECLDLIDASNSISKRSVINNLLKTKCSNNLLMDSKSGKFEITIKDLNTGKSCVFTMDKNGNALLETSTTVTIVSPNIEMTGTTHITGTLTVTQNITGEKDVIASQCTLNTHVHPVPPHCPSTGRTLVGK